MQHLESLIQAIPFSLFAQSSSLMPSAEASANSPQASFASATHSFPLGVLPPSLTQFPITNPSTHFPLSQETAPANTGLSDGIQKTSSNVLSTSYLYLDDEGYTRWQGESSGLPLLDFLVERKLPSASSNPPSDDAKPPSPVQEYGSRKPESVTTGTWFPNRRTRLTGSLPPEVMWRTITAQIPPPLMDSLIQCFLSTSHYLLPFLHVPQFLSDYGNPQKWGEPGFAAFIVAIWCVFIQRPCDHNKYLIYTYYSAASLLDMLMIRVSGLSRQMDSPPELTGSTFSASCESCLQRTNQHCTPFKACSLQQCTLSASDGCPEASRCLQKRALCASTRVYTGAAMTTIALDLSRSKSGGAPSGACIYGISRQHQLLDVHLCFVFEIVTRVRSRRLMMNILRWNRSALSQKAPRVDSEHLSLVLGWRWFSKQSLRVRHQKRYLPMRSYKALLAYSRARMRQKPGTCNRRSSSLMLSSSPCRHTGRTQ